MLSICVLNTCVVLEMGMACAPAHSSCFSSSEMLVGEVCCTFLSGTAHLAGMVAQVPFLPLVVNYATHRACWAGNMSSVTCVMLQGSCSLAAMSSVHVES